ncbi:GrpB family protein [Actinocrispum sp. NPDC049592]|uniref:GrpB family protein n=1 Tax=Actinocrispum sp. NPDC049592 TaxID=3154835 RepID=UPI00342248FD
MTTDDEILNVIVGDKPAPYSVKVVVDDYNPDWPRWYEEEASRIRSALGPIAVRLEHVGSTSVPGLPAKPIIDVILAVPDSSIEDAYVPALVAAGYDLHIRELEWHQHRVFYNRVERGHRRDVNLHVYTEGCAEYDACVVFRDWLRTHPEDLALYRDAKLELSKKDWKYVQNYADAKTPVIETIKTRAAPTPTPCPKH